MIKSEAYLIEYPSGLKNIDEIIDDLPVDKQRILELAEARMCPHWRIDGGQPLFHKSELKRWIANNILERIEGERSMPIELKIVHSPQKLVIEEPPDALSQMRHRLTQIPIHDWVPGIYFLCSGNEVVYVGQSISPLNRVITHSNDRSKTFDRVYYIPVPQSDLNDVEGAFIRALKPKYNGRARGGENIIAPRGNDDVEDIEVIERYIKNNIHNEEISEKIDITNSGNYVP